MSSPEDKQKHRKRMQRKKKEAVKRQGRIRSVIAKELITSGKYSPRVIQDKKGRQHDLEKMTHLDFVKAIQEEDS